MAWPVTRNDSFKPNSTHWNELVNSFSQWGGNVNGGGYTLSNAYVTSPSLIAGSASNGISVNPGGMVLRCGDDGINWRNVIHFTRASDGAVQHTLASNSATSNSLLLYLNYGGGASGDFRIENGSVNVRGAVRAYSGFKIFDDPNAYTIFRDGSTGHLIFQGDENGASTYSFNLKNGGVLRSALHLDNAGVLHQGIGSWLTLGNTAGDFRFFSTQTFAPTTNTGQLRQYAYRNTSGTDWSGTSYVMDFMVDGSHQSCGISFGPNTLSLHANSGVSASMAEIVQVTNKGLKVMGHTWSGAHLVLGSFHFWVDSSNRLRMHSSAPVGDTDGSIVGAQA
jgi:hypothetical protein